MSVDKIDGFLEESKLEEELIQTNYCLSVSDNVKYDYFTIVHLMSNVYKMNLHTENNSYFLRNWKGLERLLFLKGIPFNVDGSELYIKLYIILSTRRDIKDLIDILNVVTSEVKIEFKGSLIS